MFAVARRVCGSVLVVTALLSVDSDVETQQHAGYQGGPDSVLAPGFRPPASTPPLGVLEPEAGRTIRQIRHLPGAPGPIEGILGPPKCPLYIFFIVFYSQ